MILTQTSFHGSWTSKAVGWFFAFLIAAACVPAGQAQEATGGASWQPKEAPLMTRWAGDVSPESVQERPYPRPDMRRDRWENLNGLWQYAFAQSAEEDAPLGQPLEGGQILVPFAVESALSGVMQDTPDADRLFYRRTFEVPEAWESDRILLHFGAVDWDATVYVNGEEVGQHKGGYTPFSFDVTDALVGAGAQELVVDVYDPSDDGDQARGKQVKEPEGIWYTPVTGIWQTVWLEPVPAAHLADLKLTPDIDRGVLQVEAQGEGADGYTVEAVAREADGEEVGRATGAPGAAFDVPVADARLWSPSDPYLYDLTVRLVQDSAAAGGEAAADAGEAADAVESYFGMRKVEVTEDADGAPRILLNGEFVFEVGPLDQGYWPDGLYTAPTDEALRYDLEITKELGFNTTRKHVKVEPARWYYHADQIGLLVWQDMPNGDNTTAESRDQFKTELKEMMDAFYNYPSIMTWVIFNEGWGQFESEEVVRLAGWAEQYDPSRLIVDVSGWQTQGAGHVIDVHRYQGPVAVPPQEGRASIVGEFGGLGLPVEGHLWKEGSNWGYEGTFDTPEALLERYEERMRRLWHSKESADMSGGIYTQLTDVEIEVNGLLTYDREVVKVDRERVAAVNQGRTSYVLPNERRFISAVDVQIETGADGLAIHYTQDGSAPTAQSTRYTEPFTLQESATVKAQTFDGGEAVGPVVTAAFEQVEGLAAASVSEEVLAPGLQYQYFEAAQEQNETYQQHWPLRRYMEQGDRLEPVRSGTVETISLAPQQRDSLFAFSYEGYLKVPETGTYTFTIEADDSVSLLLNGEEITERGGQSPSLTTETMQVPLQAGLHAFTLRHFQAYGPATLDVYMEGPGMERQPIPAGALFHAASTSSR